MTWQMQYAQKFKRRSPRIKREPNVQQKSALAWVSWATFGVVFLPAQNPKNHVARSPEVHKERCLCWRSSLQSSRFAFDLRLLQNYSACALQKHAAKGSQGAQTTQYRIGALEIKFALQARIM